MLIVLLAKFSPAENQSSVALETNETLFTVLTAINTCGYDQELNVSDPMRTQVRSEVARAVQGSDAAKDATQAMCKYFEEHRPADPSKTLSQYISLALYLNPAPNLTARVKEADMPPDSTAVIGILPLMQKFYETAGLHNIWEGDHRAFTALNWFISFSFARFR